MTVLSATMSMRRLQMVARLHRVSLNHSCQTLEAGKAIEIDSDSKINVKYDGSSIVLDSQGRLKVNSPQAQFIDDYINRIEDELPECYASQKDFALTCDGAGVASWQPVGAYYKCVSDDEIDEMFEEEEEEQNG